MEKETVDQEALINEWAGIVLEVQRDSFIARLVDQTQEGPDEEAEFPFEEVPVGDRALIVPGAVFYWNIGYSDSLSGQRTRASVIRFRRLPVWQSEEFTRAKQEAQQLRETLGWK